MRSENGQKCRDMNKSKSAGLTGVVLEMIMTGENLGREWLINV